MSRKDYLRVAAIVAAFRNLPGTDPVAVDRHLIEPLADWFRSDNSAFRRATFEDACRAK